MPFVYATALFLSQGCILIGSVIAFYLFGNWSVAQVVQVGSINYIYKGCVALLMTPILYGAHYLIDRYLGKENAHNLANEAAASSFTAV